MIAGLLTAVPALVLALPGGAYIVAAYEFATSRIGQMLIVAAVAGYGGYSLKARLDTSAQLRARVATLQHDLNAAADAAADANNRLNTINDLVATLKQRNTDYADELAKRPDARCTLTADDIRRLRGPAGNRRR